mgnify:CR=1 FL=1
MWNPILTRESRIKYPAGKPEFDGENGVYLAGTMQ